MLFEGRRLFYSPMISNFVYRFVVLMIFHYYNNKLLMCECSTHGIFLFLDLQKTKIISLPRKRDQMDFRYSLSREIMIQCVSTVPDLGVLVDSRLTFKVHFMSILSISARMLGMVSCRTRNFFI